MRRIGYLGIVAALIVLAVTPIAYSALHLLDPTFRDSFFSNWAATVIGVIVGIPIALELNRREVTAEQARSTTGKQEEESKRRVKILSLLSKELIYDRDQILARAPEKTANAKRFVSLPGLKDELWRAFSDGGELQWVQDLDVLDALSTAYYQVRTIIYLEERFFEATHFPGLQVQQEKYPKDRIIEYLTEIDSIALASINIALRMTELLLASTK